MENIRLVYEKAVKVINSCKSRIQLKVAEQYVSNMHNLYVVHEKNKSSKAFNAIIHRTLVTRIVNRRKELR